MGRAGFGLRGLTGLLLALNAGVLLVGLAVAFWPHRGATVLEFNADKVTLQKGKDDPPRFSRDDPPAEASPQAAVDAEAKPDALCLDWESLDADTLAQVESALQRVGLAPAHYRWSLDAPLGWWVFLPPFHGAEATRQAMDELRLKGVSDMAPVRSGPLVNAVSLGALPSLERARAHAESLKIKGVAGVRFGPRLGSGHVRLTLLVEPPSGFPESLEAGLPPKLKPAFCH